VLQLSSSGISETGVRGVLFDCDGKADDVMVVEGVVSVGVVVIGVVAAGVVAAGVVAVGVVAVGVVVVVDVLTSHD
jgi:hypothetical protein